MSAASQPAGQPLWPTDSLTILTESAAVIDADLDAKDAQMVAAAALWAREFVAPMSETWEGERRFAHEAFQDAAQQGFTALLVPTADGGAGLSPFALARVLEEIAAVDLAVAFSLVCHNNLASAVSRLAPPKMRETALPALVQGEKIGAFLLTEPGAGSDAAAIAVSAEPHSGSASSSGNRGSAASWVLNGEKAWVTNGTAAQMLSVYVQTDPAKAHRGIAAFLLDTDLLADTVPANTVPANSAPANTVPADSALVRQDGYQLVGGHAMGTNGFEFKNCVVPEEALFVPVGEGFAAAMSGIDLARVLLSAMCCGMLRTALETAANYIRNRQAFGARIADLQGVRFLLADAATDLEAARLLSYRAAELLSAGSSSGGAATVAAAHAKKFTTRVVERRISDCMQVMGAAGARRDHPLPRHLAAARLANYLDGATEIQNVVLGRALLD